MKSIYFNHLETLRQNYDSAGPLLSFYVPMKNPDLAPDKIFDGLLRSSMKLLQMQGAQTPLFQIPDWELWRSQETQTLGIFVSRESTTLLPLPTRLAPRFVVADSFHIKPLITAAHESANALFISSSGDDLSFYNVTASGVSLIRHYLQASVASISDKDIHVRFLLREIESEIGADTKLIAFAGSSVYSDDLHRALKSRAVIADLSQMAAMNLTQRISVVRFRLSQIVRHSHQQAVQNSLDSSYSDPLTAGTLIPAIRGKRIRRLCISLDCLRFGNIDRKTGAVVLSRNQKSTSDDDVLDDIAEFSLDQGVEVRVVPKIYMPEGRSFLAS